MINSNLPAQARLEAFHNTYQRLTNRTERFSLHERSWYEWSKYFNNADLETVLLYVLKANSTRDRRYHINLALEEIIDPQRFDSLLADSLVERKRLAAQARKVQPSEGQRQLSAMRHEPVPEPTQPEKRISMDLIIEGMRKAANENT